MPEDTIRTEVPFRTKLLEPVTVSVVLVKKSFHYAYPFADVRFREHRSEYGFVMDLRYLQFDDYAEDKRENMERAVLDEILRFAKWCVINGSFRSWTIPRRSTSGDPAAKRTFQGGGGPLEMIVVSPVDRTTDKYDFQFDDRDGDWRILHPPLRRVDLEEHQLGRRILLGELYGKGQTTRQLEINAHFPPNVISEELDGLAASGFVTRLKGTASHFDPCSLTHSGRELYEKSETLLSGIAFVIAACEADDRPLQSDVLVTYKAAIRAAGLEPRFQEHEEPYKNIYTDIFDYIAASEFVIADITYERASCYIEIGYALALQKQVLLFVDEEHFNKDMNGRVPFDLFATKYQTYKRTDRADLQTKCAERIKVVQSRRFT